MSEVELRMPRMEKLLFKTGGKVTLCFEFVL